MLQTQVTHGMNMRELDGHQRDGDLLSCGKAAAATHDCKEGEDNLEATQQYHQHEKGGVIQQQYHELDEEDTQQNHQLSMT